MPDEFKDLINELGGNATPPTPQPTTPPEPSATPADPAPSNPAPAEPSATPAEPTATPPAPQPNAGTPSKPTSSEDNPQARAFAEMRAKNTKYERALSSAAKAAGLTTEQYLEKLEADSLNQRAETLKTDPEVLRRLEQAEAEIESYRVKTVENFLINSFEGLKAKLSLTDAEITEFTETLQRNGHDFRNMTVNYEALYRGMNFDKMIEKERQAWIAQDAKARSQGSTPLPTNGRNGTPATKEIKTAEELDEFLRGIPGQTQ